MAKQVLEIKDFSSGLNAFSDPRDIKVGEFSRLYNASPSQVGIIKFGGALVESVYNLPHDNSNFQIGYGLFSTSIDTTPTILDGQFESAFEEGTVVACSSTSLTLALLPTFQSKASHNTNNFYRNMTVLIYEGTGIGESRRIVSYAYTDADPDTHIATLESAFSAAVDSSSKYKIFRWAGDNSTFGNSGNKNYIDKGGSDFPYDDITAHEAQNENSYFLRSKVSSITNNQSSSLGFITYNPKSSTSWAAGDVLASNSTTIGNNTLQPGVKYTLSFWVKCSAKYYDYVADTNHSDIYPFIQIYSDSVTDETNTGLYLFQGKSGPAFISGSESSYQYAQNITKNYVVNGDFEDGSATGGDGGQGTANGGAGDTTYNPPTSWMAYDGWNATTNDAITYSFETGADAYGDEGNTLKMTFGSAIENKIVNFNGQGGMTIPSCYMYQDITLEDNQWYDLSFITSKNAAAAAPMFSILDQNNLVSTGVYAAETEAAADGSVTLTVDNGSGAGSAATNELLQYQEVYKSNGTFLGVCTSVTNNTTLVFAGGTAAQITDDDVLYTARYLTNWIRTAIISSTLTDYTNIPYEATGIQSVFSDTNNTANKFFVPDNNGTPTKIRLGLSAFAVSGNIISFDSICIKKSFPNLESMCKKDGKFSNKVLPHPRDNEITEWNKYTMNFKIPSEYNAVNDWVINLHAGKRGFQTSATGNVDNHTLYFDTIQIESSSLGSDLIFLNDNTSTESKINIYNEENNIWIDNSGLTWSGIKMKPVYNYINGMLKISDANFDSGNSTKLLYYQDDVHKVRDNELALNPPLLISAVGNAAEVDQKFNASDYMNAVTFDGAHQAYVDTDNSLADTNATGSGGWALDDLYGQGRLLSYYVPNVNHVGGEHALLTDAEENPTSLGLAETNGDTDITTARLVANPSYYMWAGAATGSGTASTTDMQSTMSAYTTGSIANVYFTFNYTFQGANQVGSTTHWTNRLSDCPPPYFEITIGKRSSASTDIFDASDGIPTAAEKKALSVGGDANTTIDIENGKFATVYTMDDELYNAETVAGFEDAAFHEHPLWDTTGWEDPVSHRSRKDSKTFTSITSFDDGDIELTDDMIMKIDVIWEPRPGHSGTGRYILQNHGLGEYGGANIAPIYERIKFINCNVSFRATNWTVLTDGLSAADKDKSKVDFSFGAPTSSTAFGWGERIFKLGVSTVNIFDEESNVLENPENIGGTISNNLITSTHSISAGQCPDINIYVGYNIFDDDYKKELKYYMKDTESNIWYLQFYVDLKKKKAYSTTSNFSTNGILDDANENIVFTIPKEKMLNYNEVDSYESQTLVSQDLKASELVCDYKTSIVANSRLYVGNIRQDGAYYPDRMLKSPIGKYNILPKSNFIDVAINDGDEITALEYYKDKLLQFKKRKVFVINISGDYEFLEDTFDIVGVRFPYQVTKTPYGIVWVNSKGCFLYNGESLVNLVENKIPIDEKDAIVGGNWWLVSDTDTYGAMIGYDAKSKDIVITRNLNQSSSSAYIDGWIYNMQTQSWYATHRAFTGISKNTINPLLSNFSTNKDGSLISYGKNTYTFSGSIAFNEIFKWQHNEANDEAICARKGVTGSSVNNKVFYYDTADFTFGNIAARKKIYKIYITYKSMNSSGSSMNSNVLVKYAVNGTNTFSTFSDSSTNYAASTGLAGATEWTTAILLPSSSINNIYSLKLRVFDENLSDSSAVRFQINDISIVYREKRVK